MFLPTVLLLHTLPDGAQHVDWLIAWRRRGDPDERNLTAFRCPARVDALSAGEEMAIERIADHRRLYLRHEGPIGEGRGEVRRLAEGAARLVEACDDGWRLVVRWRDRTRRRRRRQRLIVRQVGDRWLVRQPDADGR